MKRRLTGEIKFFNRVIYLSEFERTEGTHTYITV